MGKRTRGGVLCASLRPSRILIRLTASSARETRPSPPGPAALAVVPELLRSRACRRSGCMRSRQASSAASVPPWPSQAEERSLPSGLQGREAGLGDRCVDAIEYSGRWAQEQLAREPFEQFDSSLPVFLFCDCLFCSPPSSAAQQPTSQCFP